MVTKINPVTDYSQARCFLGKTITVLDIATGVALTAENGPTGAISVLMKTISQKATIVAYGPLTNTNQDIQVWIEGEFPADDYNADGTPVTFGDWLDGQLDGLTSVGAGPVTLAGTVTTETAVLKADQVIDHVVA